MSLVPVMLQDQLFQNQNRRWQCPSKISDQQFGLSLNTEDIFQPLNVNDQLLTRTPAGYLRNWRSDASQKDAGSTITIDQDKFLATLDVQQFRPEEINVQLMGDNILKIEGKQEEKRDEEGLISRHFVRRYILPNEVDTNKLETKLSSDGVLIIMAPMMESKKQMKQKQIQVKQTGQPAKQQMDELKK